MAAMNEQGFIHAPFCCTVDGRHVTKWNHPMGGILHGSARVQWLPCVHKTVFDEQVVRQWFTRKGLDVLACNLAVLNARGDKVYAMDFVCEGVERDMFFLVLESEELRQPCGRMKLHMVRMQTRIYSLTGIRYECYILNLYDSDKIKCYRI